MRAIIRWALLVPATVGAWYAVFIAGIAVHQTIERRACPPAELVSGGCADPGVLRLLHAVVYVFIALSAVAVVATATAIAPSAKRLIAGAAFVVGAGLAIWLSVAAKAYGEGVGAICAGLATVIAVYAIERRRKAGAGNPEPALN
jgi:hypothetical protein